jgi:cephalosporin hydroxylase
LDLCFVDGAHHDSAVIADIEAWKPLVKDGGFMLFHDYDHPNVPGLTVIVDDMMADWKRIGSSRYLVAFQNV